MKNQKLPPIKKESSKYKDITQQKVDTIIDEETGEIISTTSSTTFRVEKEPDFIKLYLDDVLRLNDLPKGMSPILFRICKIMSYNNIVVLINPIKQMISNDLNISISYVNKCIDIFHKKGILIRIRDEKTQKQHRGVYLVDPELFGKGQWKDIKSLRLVVDYKPNGTKEIKSNMSDQLQLKLGL